MRTRLLLTTVGAVMVGVAGLELLPTPASTGVVPGRAPELSVQIDNQRTRVASGDRVDYVVRVHNSAAHPYENVRITQQLPEALRPSMSRPVGEASEDQVAWTATIPARSDASFVLTARVRGPDDTAVEYPKVVTTGCVGASTSGRPVACDTDTDALRVPARSPTGSAVLFGIGLAIVVVVLGFRARPRREPRPVRPVPVRRPYRRRRALVPAMREESPEWSSDVFAPTSSVRRVRWLNVDPARGPPAGGTSRRSPVRS